MCSSISPTNTIRWLDVGLTLGHRLRRSPNIGLSSRVWREGGKNQIVDRFSWIHVLITHTAGSLFQKNINRLQRWTRYLCRCYSNPLMILVNESPYRNHYCRGKVKWVKTRKNIYSFFPAGSIVYSWPQKGLCFHDLVITKLWQINYCSYGISLENSLQLHHFAWFGLGYHWSKQIINVERYII